MLWTLVATNHHLNPEEETCSLCSSHSKVEWFSGSRLIVVSSFSAGKQKLGLIPSLSLLLRLCYWPFQGRVGRGSEGGWWGVGGGSSWLCCGGPASLGMRAGAQQSLLLSVCIGSSGTLTGNIQLFFVWSVQFLPVCCFFLGLVFQSSDCWLRWSSWEECKLSSCQLTPSDLSLRSYVFCPNHRPLIAKRISFTLLPEVLGRKPDTQTPVCYIPPSMDSADWALQICQGAPAGMRRASSCTGVQRFTALLFLKRSVSEVPVSLMVKPFIHEIG